ncbi:MAG: type VI secretion system baseplate subunit TssG [Planctomycetaceae bacterium]
MGTEGQRQDVGLIDQLKKEPYRFDFFQAVRLLEHAARESKAVASKAIGSDHEPGEEVVRFRALPSLTFPSGPIAQIKTPEEEQPVEMTVAFMGLTGPSGVLPSHYTSTLIERAHTRYKDRAMLEFFDLFNHRTISLFYRAWEKYRFPYAYERHHLLEEDGEGDLFTFCLFSLCGLGADGLRNRQSFDDELILYYGGHFAHQPRSAIGLQHMLVDHLGCDVEVNEFCGQWLYLDEDNQSMMPSRRHPDGRNLALGTSTVIGSRVWDVQSRFRLRVGPLSRQEFSALMPGGSDLTRITELVRLYVGPEFDFDIQLVLQKEDVPSTRLNGRSQLGWNSWMQSGEPETDVDDAVFHVE